MKFIISFLILIIIARSEDSSQFVPFKLGESNSQFIDSENFGIRTKPILNREYLVFLSWQISVYGLSYPERIIAMLPREKLINEIILNRQTNFEDVIKNLQNINFQEYILNPKYLNYPVVGLSNNQISIIQRWMSDRYNENVLIEAGYLDFNPNQQNSECFVLESYLTDQYTGAVRNGKKLYWKDNKFLPTFRLPYHSEMRFLELNLKDPIKLRKYKFNRRDFLWNWDNFFIDVNKAKNEIHFNLANPFSVHNEKSVELDLMKVSDEILSDDTVLYFDLKYFDEGDYVEKDKYGIQPFRVIGESNLDRPIIATPMKFQDETALENKIYWIAYQKKVDFEMWPRE